MTLRHAGRPCDSKFVGTDWHRAKQAPPVERR
jgi:hypothetical protein